MNSKDNNEIGVFCFVKTRFSFENQTFLGKSKVYTSIPYPYFVLYVHKCNICIYVWMHVMCIYIYIHVCIYDMYLYTCFLSKENVILFFQLLLIVLRKKELDSVVQVRGNVIVGC